MKTPIEDTSPASPTSPEKTDRAVKRSVSLPQSMADAAERRAAESGRSVSNYIQRLIQKDVEASEGAEGVK